MATKPSTKTFQVTKRRRTTEAKRPWGRAALLSVGLSLDFDVGTGIDLVVWTPLLALSLSGAFCLSLKLSVAHSRPLPKYWKQFLWPWSRLSRTIHHCLVKGSSLPLSVFVFHKFSVCSASVFPLWILVCTLVSQKCPLSYSSSLEDWEGRDAIRMFSFACLLSWIASRRVKFCKKCNALEYGEPLEKRNRHWTIGTLMRTWLQETRSQCNRTRVVGSGGPWNHTSFDLSW